jgi:hypothetical protein
VPDVALLLSPIDLDVQLALVDSVKVEFLGRDAAARDRKGWVVLEELLQVPRVLALDVLGGHGHLGYRISPGSLDRDRIERNRLLRVTGLRLPQQHE